MLTASQPELTLEWCTYCGVIADSVDHVPPMSARARIIESKLDRIYPFKIVPCCRECNSALGARALWSVYERKAWVKQWIRRRYARYLKIPDWTQEDLARLGPILREFTENGLKRRDLIRKRLSW